MEKIYRHFKGGYYRFVTEVTNSETQEKEVVYQALYGEHKVWTRPAAMFYGKVNVDGVEIDRFTEVVGLPVLFKKTQENAIMPSKAHDDDFCYDCYAVSEEEVAPNVWKYGLGFALQIENRNKPADISRCFTFRPRSSVWKTGMILSNCEGTVDDPYTGEISAVFYHVMPNMPRYKVGDKIVQFHLETSDNIMFIETDELKKTERGDNGYGSSDKNGMVL